jgi:hypothetical protein
MHQLILRRPSPALVVACLALIAALVGNARAVTGDTARASSTINTYVEDFTVAPGQVKSGISACQRPSERAIDGGYSTASGNFVYILGASVRKGDDAFFVLALVPNKIAAPGVLPARIKVRVVCAKKGVPVVP